MTDAPGTARVTSDDFANLEPSDDIGVIVAEGQDNSDEVDFIGPVREFDRDRDELRALYNSLQQIT